MEAAANLVAERKFDEAKALLGRAVATAKEQSAGLSPKAAEELLTAADAAQKMEQDVDRAATSAQDAKLFGKRSKAEAQQLKKK